MAFRGEKEFMIRFPGFSVNAKRPFGSRLDQLGQPRSVLAAGFRSQEGAAVMRVLTQFAEDFDQKIPLRALGVAGDHADLIHDHLSAQLVGQIHGPFGRLDPFL